jgi:predicted lipoprotein with Yx(FWY)xxD motif
LLPVLGRPALAHSTIEADTATVRRFLLASAASLVIVLGGAGGGGTAVHREVATRHAPPVTLPGNLTNKGTRAATGDRISIDERDLSFAPTFVKARAGATLTVTVHNVGTLVHTFTIPGRGVDVALRPGASATLQVVVPTTGALMFFCRFHGYSGTPSGGSGMQGAFFTKPGDTITNAAAAAVPPANGTLRVSSTRFGAVLVDAYGRTVYLRDGDTATHFTCTGACAKQWPPLLVTGRPTPGCPCVDPAKLGTARGPNGRQLTYAGHLLYLYAGDRTPGDANGEGVHGFWVVDEAGNRVTREPSPVTGG